MKEYLLYLIQEMCYCLVLYWNVFLIFVSVFALHVSISAQLCTAMFIFTDLFLVLYYIQQGINKVSPFHNSANKL